MEYENPIENTNQDEYSSTPYLHPIYILDQFYLRENLPPVNANHGKIIDLEKLHKRHEQIMVGDKIQYHIDRFADSVRSLLESFMIADDPLFTVIEEVGSYRKDVMIIERSEPYTVDYVVLIDHPLPYLLVETVENIRTALIAATPYQVSENMDLDIEIKEFDMLNASFTVNDHQRLHQAKILIGLVSCGSFADHGGLSIIQSNLLEQRLNIIKRTRWFMAHTSLKLKLLVRLFKDLKRRYNGFRRLDSWMLEVLLQYCLVALPPGYEKDINVAEAFLRAFQLLSAGIFLPDSVSLYDPIQSTKWTPIHRQLDDSSLDQICCTAQTLLRIMNFVEGFEVVIGLRLDKRNIEEEDTIWEGVVIKPSVMVQHGDSVYNNSKKIIEYGK